MKIKYSVDSDYQNPLSSVIQCDSENNSGLMINTGVFIDKISSGVAVRLNNPSDNKDKMTYHLLLWIPSNDFFVSISQSCTEKTDEQNSLYVLKDILSTKQFEKIFGIIPTKHYIRSGKKAFSDLPLDSYHLWRYEFLKKYDPKFYSDLKIRKIEVFITYLENDSEKEYCTNLGRPDVPKSFLAKEGVHNAMHHPNFWNWFYNSIQEKGELFKKRIERATGIFLKIIDESPIMISVPSNN